MVVGAVECRGFRNLADARTSLGAGVVVVHGPNGAGKTNLLEASTSASPAARSAPATTGT